MKSAIYKKLLMRSAIYKKAPKKERLLMRSTYISLRLRRLESTS